MTYSKAKAEQEASVGGPLIDVTEVLDRIADVLDWADVTPGDIVDDFLQLVSLLAPEPGHHMLACNKARAAAQAWLEANEEEQP